MELFRKFGQFREAVGMLMLEPALSPVSASSRKPELASRSSKHRDDASSGLIGDLQ